MDRLLIAIRYVTVIANISTRFAYGRWATALFLFVLLVFFQGRLSSGAVTILLVGTGKLKIGLRVFRIKLNHLLKLADCFVSLALLDQTAPVGNAWGDGRFV